MALLGRGDARRVKTMEASRTVRDAILNVLKEAGELAEDLLLEDIAEPGLQRGDAHVLAVQAGPDALGEEVLLGLVPFRQGGVPGLVAAVFEHMPPQPEHHVLVLGETDEGCLHLRPLVESVGFGDEAQRPVAGGIQLSCELRDVLERSVILCGHDGQDDAPGPFHVALDHLPDRFGIVERLFLVPGPEETGQVHHGQMGLVRPAELDAERVGAELLGVGEHHGGLGLVHNVPQGPLVLSIHDRVEVAQPLAFLLGTLGAGVDGHPRRRNVAPAEDQLGGEPGAQVVLGGERHARDGLKDGALPGGLVPADDDLGQIDIPADPLRPELVDDVQEVAVVFGLEGYGVHGGPAYCRKQVCMMDIRGSGRQNLWYEPHSVLSLLGSESLMGSVCLHISGCEHAHPPQRN